MNSVSTAVKNTAADRFFDPDLAIRSIASELYSDAADIPLQTEYTRNLLPLLNRYGNDSRLTLILFTLDETTHSRELAAGDLERYSEQNCLVSLNRRFSVRRNDQDRGFLYGNKKRVERR